MKAFAREPIEIIPEWLAATRDLDVPTGLSREEARLRAGKLRNLIREGKVSPKQLELDEDGKDVLWALVKLLGESGDRPGQAMASEADTVYRFIEGSGWPADRFDEKRQLLRDCATLGWSALGWTVEKVERSRSFEEEESLSTEHAVCRLLFERRDAEAAAVVKSAANLFFKLLGSPERVGSFDEKDFVLGELALLAGGSSRHLGQTDESDQWFSTAESHFEQLIRPSRKLAELAYQRLALLYDLRCFEEVIRQSPALLTSCVRLDLTATHHKARLLLAISLKGVGRLKEAFEILDDVSRLEQVHPQVMGHVLTEVGALYATRGCYEVAMDKFAEAHGLLARQGSPLFELAHLKAIVGEMFALQGRMVPAVEALKEAIHDYSSVQMIRQEAYLHVVLADWLTQAGRHEEAESEILAALPTIEEQKMGPECVTAVALLKESVSRQKADPNALRALREYLQCRN